MGADVVLTVNLNRNYFAAVDDIGADIDNLEEAIAEDNSLDILEPKTDLQFIETLRSQYNILTETLKTKLEHWLPSEQAQINIFDIIGTTINIMEQKVTRLNLEVDPPEILIEPDLCKFGIFDFHQADMIINEGYQRTRKVIPALHKLLAD